jgi:hypothetical protein
MRTRRFPGSCVQQVAFTFLLVQNLPGHAQELLRIPNGCVYSGDAIKAEVYSFESDLEAEGAVRRVMKHTGLPANFELRAADIANAEARTLGSTRYILYNQLFMHRVKQQTNTDWAAISILAHEIGHHLSGHTLDGQGSRPPKELEADKFSGFVLSKMGASLEQSLAAMKAIASDYGSSTHPPKSARLAAITNGWQAARDYGGAAPDPEPVRPVVKHEPLKPSATIERVWLEHNVFDGYRRKGMRIHIKFSQKNMLGRSGEVAAYFAFENGSDLKDFNGTYRTRDGKVSCGTRFNSKYESSTFEDYVLFMPVEELHLGPGRHSLKFNITIWDLGDPASPRLLTRSAEQFFTRNP